MLAPRRPARSPAQEAFGFTEIMVVPGPDDTIAHAQLAFAGGMVMVGSLRDDELKMQTPCDLGGVTQSIYIVVEDADAHYARAVEAGAEIVRELEDTPYGSRDFSARDPEGHLDFELPAGHRRMAGKRPGHSRGLPPFGEATRRPLL